MSMSPRCADELHVEATGCELCRANPRAAPVARAWSAPLSVDSYAGRVLLAETRWPAAPFVRRLVAAAVDAGIIATVGIPGGLMIVQGWFSDSGRSLGLIVGGSALTLAALAYALMKDGWRGGAGVGKRLLGLRVVHVETGAPCTLVRAIARDAAMVAFSSVPYGGWAIEPLVAMVAAGGRRLGDHLAGTQVVTRGVPSSASPDARAAGMETR